jgi:hypothetical protein
MQYHDRYTLEDLDEACERDIQASEVKMRYLTNSDEQLLTVGFRVFGQGCSKSVRDMEHTLKSVLLYITDSTAARIVYLYRYYLVNGEMPDTRWSGARWQPGVVKTLGNL